MTNVKYNGGTRPTFRGELRKERNGHFNQKNTATITEIGWARCREVYDLGVEDDPHLFALASGILTHNSKPNPMPESVEDRPTKSHEYIFLLAKSEKYFYDSEAIKEKAMQPNGDAKLTGQIKRDVLQNLDRSTLSTNQGSPYRNKRSVWTIATTPYSGAHFATFPPGLISPCIQSGTSEYGCCPKCGAPWERIVEKGESCPEPNNRNPKKRLEPGQAGNVGAGNIGFRASRLSGQEQAAWKAIHPDRTTGWQPTCECGITKTIPCTVLDPFAGSGTTGEVCEKLGRNSILIELNPEYIELIKQRTGQMGLFAG